MDEYASGVNILYSQFNHSPSPKEAADAASKLSGDDVQFHAGNPAQDILPEDLINIVSA